MSYKSFVAVPYIGMDEHGDTTRNWAHMHFTQADKYPDRRKIKRAVRWWVKKNLDRSLHSEELAMIMKRVIRFDTAKD